MTRLLYVGPLWNGSTATQRANGMRRAGGVELLTLDSGERVGRATLIDRVRHRLRWPRDRQGLNGRLVRAVAEQRPDIVFIDSTRVVTRQTLRALRRLGVSRLAFYSPDDVSARHNSSRQLEGCDAEWDVFFTTKSFNVPELADRGVARPLLVGKAYDPELHRPMSADEVGAEFERADLVFVGTYEIDRCRSINALAEAGMSVRVRGNSWPAGSLRADVELLPAQFADDYTRSLHEGKLALCFLRKLNRDRVTQRSVEIPAAARPMLAEKTAEHDELFDDGSEYLSFVTDDELVSHARALLADSARRREIALAGHRRCIASGYSSIDRAREMLAALGADTPAAEASHR